MEDAIALTHNISANGFTRAGGASSDAKRKLKQMGIDSEAIRKMAITMHEGEISMVIHASGGLITVEVTPQQIKMILADMGPGIPDTGLATQAGYPITPDEIRSLGLGMSISFPNMRRCSDSMEINTKLGERTTITMTAKI